MPAPASLRRAAYLVACLAPAWAVITIVFDGISWRLGPLRVSSTEPLRPILVGVLAAAGYLWGSSRDERDADGAWLASWSRRLARLSVPAVVLLGGVVGLTHGTFAASGSDAYGYVSQAALWLRGDLRIEQPIVAEVSWPDAAWTFTPLGYRPISDSGTIVPTYSPGLPIMMAVFQALLGATGVFYVVPLLGCLALICTYALGTAATASRSVGAMAAMLLLASPVFLSHLMVPMTDVPVAAAWTLTLVLALREPAPRPLLSGVAAGWALLIRPNLVLVAAGPLFAWLFRCGGPRPSWRPTRRFAALFVAGLLPAVLAIAAINATLYGSPFESSYGGLSDLYGVGAAPQNVRRYTGWLIDTQTPLVALALIPVFWRGALRACTPRSSARAGLVAIATLVCVSYLFYAPFENWTYLRFLLPAYPALFVLMAAAVRVLCLKLPLPARAPVAILSTVMFVSFGVQFARDQYVFNWRAHEQRYVRAASRASELTPDTAVLFSSQHSGSLRYYTGRITLRYDLLAQDRLDSAVRELMDKGRPSFLVIDEWERAEFSNRFAAGNRAGSLEWAPLVRVPGQPDVLIYALSDRVE